MSAYEEFCFAVKEQGATAQDLQKLRASIIEYQKTATDEGGTAAFFKTEREAIEQVLQEFFSSDLTQN